MTSLIDRLVSAVSPRPLPIFHDPLYRFPVPRLEAALGIEPRRADFVRWFLDDRHEGRFDWRRPSPISYKDLARAHPHNHLARLTSGEIFAQLFHLAAEEVPIDALMLGVRLATGATCEAAALALDDEGAVFNLLGGFHHAAPEKAAGLCPVNDIAAAILWLRHAHNFVGDVLILDLDAHPPDGLAAFFAGDERVRIGSLSGSDWGPLPGVDETVLAEDTADAPYLDALNLLLARQPPGDLHFIIAGGDVLEGDRMGVLGLTERGARRRDRAVAEHTDGRAAVWLPGGGYHPSAWRLLAQSALEAADIKTPLPRHFDPLMTHYRHRSKDFTLGEAVQQALLTDDDLDEMFGGSAASKRRTPRFLGLYLQEDLECALLHYGLTGPIEAMGYTNLSVHLDHTPEGDRVRIFGQAKGASHLVVEIVAERSTTIDGDLERPVLFINWLTLRDPLRSLDDRGLTPLPGQDVPGLGLADEANRLLLRIAARAHLEGLMLRPAWYHIAVIAVRAGFRFADDARHARFVTLREALKGVPLAEASHRVANGAVELDGAPYVWEATDLVFWPR